MAVSPEHQKQGLAGYLMRIFDAEVIRRGAEEGKHLVLYISTIKEMDERFYLGAGSRRTTWWPGPWVIWEARWSF